MKTSEPLAAIDGHEHRFNWFYRRVLIPFLRWCVRKGYHD